MAIKRIMCLLGGTETDARVTAATVAIARRFSAQVHFLFVRDLAQRVQMVAAFDIAAYPISDVSADVGKRLAEREAAAKAAFEAAGPNGFSFEALDGTYPALVSKRGGAYDLIVLSRPDDNTEAPAREALEAALFDTGTPVLLVPPGAPAELGRTVMIAWNRSVQARRALTAAMPWLEGAARVIVFHVKTNAKHGPVPQRIVNYLAAHGIKAEALEIAPDQRKIGQAVLDAGRETQADLIVMGAYSSNRLRELILGGVTGFMFDKADRPLLMAH